MDNTEFSEQIKKVSLQANNLADKLNNEEATKNALIMPFFSALGYNVFDPTEFVPEYTADFGSKKGERVDYAIILNNEVQILIEAKELNNDLSKNDSQLFRYFTATKAKFGILTNGNIYKFYTDLDEKNIMDKTPFLTVKLSELKDQQISELFKFTKANFDIDRILSSASDLKYVGLVKEYLGNQISKPNEDFVKLVLDNIYSGMKTKQVIEQFTPVISKGFLQIISDQVNEKLNKALNQTISDTVPVETQKEINEDDSEIITTSEELEAYTVSKVILQSSVDPDRIYYRDNKSYFNVLLDNSIRKWILRVYFNSNRNYIVLNDDKNTEIEFSTPIEISKYSKEIISIVKSLL